MLLLLRQQIKRKYTCSLTVWPRLKEQENEGMVLWHGAKEALKYCFRKGWIKSSGWSLKKKKTNHKPFQIANTIAKTFKTGLRSMILYKISGSCMSTAVTALKSQPILLLVSLFPHQTCRKENTFCD